VHGSRQQHGVNFWETYAPVVNWSTVWLVLTLSLLNGFKTRQVDFVQAFTQAPLDCLIFIEIPAGFSIVDGNLQFTGDFVLRLTKNMYGLHQAGHNWYKRLYDELLSAGFTQSRVDKCLFIRHNCIVVVYVDDCLIFSKDNAVLDSLINHLGSKFCIASDINVGAYLGLDIRKTLMAFLKSHNPG
jgi:hypothetical protein